MKNIPLFKVFMSDSVSRALGEVLHSGYIGEGPKVKEFEAAPGGYIGNKNVLTMNSGTSALHLVHHIALNLNIYCGRSFCCW